MPSRKQRRRRAKLHRHEYEYFVETEEGEEIPVERPREQEGAKDGRGGKQPLDRRGRPVQKPSLERVLKRTAIFGPLLVIVVFITARNATTSAKILNAIILILIFIPFSYAVDRLVYRAHMRRQGRR